MLGFLLSVLGVLLTILIVVGVHEWGHFIVARLCGIKILRFSIGFGKPLYRWHDKHGTEFVIAAIPLGGYVKMLDETEGDVAKNELHLSYNRQPIYKRMMVVAAGPLINLAFAFLMYWVIFSIGFTSIKPIIGQITPGSIADKAGMKPQQEIVQVDNKPVTSWYATIIKLFIHTGEHNSISMVTDTVKTRQSNNYSLDLSTWHMDELRPDPLISLGIVPYEPPIPAVIKKIQEDSPAANAGLMPGDKIIALDDRKIIDWFDLVTKIVVMPGENVNLQVLRAGKVKIVPLTIGIKHYWFKKKGFLGVMPVITPQPDLLRYNKYNPIAAIPHAWNNTTDFIHLNFILIGKMITGKVSLQSLGGPITIFESAGTALNAGIIPFLSFLAFLSISIGIINILPIPGLDGGHILFQTIELILRRPLSMRVQLLFFRLGIILLLILITQALVNDMMRVVV